MTERSPEVLATANLIPISPAPVHPSSPVVVPTLQDQADTLSNMSLSSSGQNGPTYTATPASLTALEQTGARIENGMNATNGQYDSHDVDEAASSDNDSLYGDVVGNGKIEGQEDGTSLIKDKDGNAQHSGQHDGTAEVLQDVSKNNESTLSSDTSQSLTYYSEAASRSHDISTHTTQDVHQHVPISNPTEAQQPLKPREEQSVNASSTDADQPPITAATENSDHPSSAVNDETDIQSLVDKIIGNASADDTDQISTSQSSAHRTAPPQAVSLPPRPPMPQQPTQSYVRPEETPSYQPASSYSNATMAMSNIPPPPGTYPIGAPGTAPDRRDTLPPPPSSSYATFPAHSLPVAHFDNSYNVAATAAPTQLQTAEPSQPWETFLQEERQYVSEAKWDRFPEGSRLFIGNLSSDRVTKKEVFDIFSEFGRLAQISLKQAYGFVQYHTLAEGEAAMDHLQGIEVRGRKIHLEFSRTQKKDGDGERRGNKGKRDSDRHDSNRRRDDYRPSRQPSPKRGGHRQQMSPSSGRGYYDDYSPRGRSRSPDYGRRDSDHYRRRSRSPHRRHISEPDVDIPRRYGGEVPDVQFLLLQEVDRDFVSWVERTFVSQGLRVQVMFLHPHFPRDAVIQRQVMEGVHAVAELDFRAQQTATISLQVFNRSAGRDNVQYDQYQDLDPNIAAQLVARAKSQVPLQPPYGVQYPPAYYPPPAQPPYLPPSYPVQPYPSAGIPPPPSNSGSSLDNATLQRILGTLHNQQAPPQSHSYGQPVGGAPVDMNGMLGTMGRSSHVTAPGPNSHHSRGYPSGPMNGAPNSGSGESAQHVQNIMAQLARYRQ